jgi:subtilisin family serine protease
MIWLAWARLVVCVLVSVMLIGGGAFAQSADNLRRIVTFNKNLDLTTTLGYLTAVSLVTVNGIQVVEPNLGEIINALVIQLPAAGISLPASLYILDVSLDPLGLVDQIIPSLAPTIEDWDWGHKRIEVPAAHGDWPSNVTGAAVRVAILDTGIDSNHPDLYPIESGYNALPGRESESPQDDHGHGTHMAGIIGALVNGKGIKGGGPPHPRVSLVPVKVLDQSGSGYLSYFLNGMQWVSRTNIRLVNMSFGFDDNSALKNATKRLYDKGVIMVAAAGCKRGIKDESAGGDGGCDTATVYDSSQLHGLYPAGYDGTIAVGAIDYYNRVADYSGSGPWLDVLASGGSIATGKRILSTTLGGGYGYGSGNSQATAHVTATCALALQLNQKLSFGQVRSILQTTATELIDPSTGKPYPPERQGAGLIDADKVDKEAVKKPE